MEQAWPKPTEAGRKATETQTGHLHILILQLPKETPEKSVVSVKKKKVKSHNTEKE